MSKKALLIIANQNFKDKEYSDVRKMLEDYGVEVIVAAKERGKARGVDGMTVGIDVSLADVITSQYDAVIFIGGGGAKIYFDDDEALEIARNTNSAGKLLGAICLAPAILAKAGLLSGVRSTVHESAKTVLIDAGADYTGEPVESYGNIITGNGPEAAEEFGEKIALMLASDF